MLLIGMLMGGRDPSVRSVLGLDAAQRNVAAAILNSPGTMTLPFVLAASIVLLLILLPTARLLGKRATAPGAAQPPTPLNSQKKEM